MFFDSTNYRLARATISNLFNQVEYAIEAIKLGSTAIGIQTSDGVVVAVEKRITSTLMEPHTIEKIVEVQNPCLFLSSFPLLNNLQAHFLFITVFLHQIILPRGFV